MRKYHSALGGGALALALILSGCGGHEPAGTTTESPEPAPSSTSTSTEPSPEPATEEEKALAQLEDYLDVRDDALRAAKIDFKRLNQVATGKEFLSIQQIVSATERSGGKWTGEYVHTLSEPRDRGAYMLITDCEDRSGVEQTKDGKPVPDPVGPDGEPVPNPLPIDYTLVKEKGRWLVSEKNGRLDESC